MDSLINNKQLALFNQILLQAFQHFKIRLDSHSSAPVKLKVEPFFELTADPKQQSIWCIHAYYKPLAALLPSTEIYQFLCRLLQHREIATQDRQEFISIVCHYTQNQLCDDMNQAQLFACYRAVMASLSGQARQENNHEISQPILIDAQNLLDYANHACLQIRQVLLDHFSQTEILRWYFLIYHNFTPRSYYLFGQSLLPVLPELRRWEMEHPNRAVWFLFFKDLDHISDPSYFSYVHLMSLQHLGSPIFQHQGHIKKLFALPSEQFIQTLQLAFNSSVERPYLAMILIKITLEATPEQLEQFSSLSYCVAMDHQYDYQPAYIEQYVHALKLSLECFMAANQAFELEFTLNDFFFGNQIQHNMQTNLPNIALVHPKMTLKSAAKHSNAWHRLSQHLQVQQHAFTFAPYQLEMHEAQFELIHLPEQLQAEAQQMQHCVLSYAQRLSEERYYCFRVHYADFRGTLGVVYHPEHATYELNQLMGIRNTPAPEHLLRIAQVFTHHLTVEDIVFQNLAANR